MNIEYVVLCQLYQLIFLEMLNKIRHFLKIIWALDVNSAMKRATYFSITLACFVIVFWKSVQCGQKYIQNPQGTMYSLKHTSQVPQFPAMTICPTIKDAYAKKRDHLKICGLRYIRVYFS